MAKFIVVTSGKGGVGKTTVSVFLGAKLAERGKRVVICDLDFGLNNSDIVMGLENKINFDLTDALEGRCRASQVFTESECTKNLYMVSSTHAIGGSASAAQNIKQLFEGMKNAFDYVILDCPAGIDAGFHRAVCACDCALVVVTPTLSSLRDADKVLSVLRSYNPEWIKLVANKVRGDLMASGECLTYAEIEGILKTPLIGAIPEDYSILLSANSSLSNTTKSGRAFAQLADNLLNDKTRLFDYSKEYSGIIGSIKCALKRKI